MMKKNLLSVLVAGLLVSPCAFGQTITDIGLEAQHADVSMMDWDNDGDLDLLVSGETGGGATFAINLKAYLNNGTGSFTEVAVPFTPITRGSFSWNDVNRDGRPDLLQNGFAPAGAFARIYNSNGTGTFTENPFSLPQMSPTSGFADFNNDGYIDIYIFGNDGQGKAKILFNDKVGGFVDQNAFNNYSFTFDPDVTVVDFDNDRDLDMFISAGDVSGARFSRLFKNNNGVFTEAITLAPEKGYGGSTWGDYDGDGFLDILMNGSGVPGDDFKYKLYKNNGGNTFTEVNSWIYGQFSTGDGGRFFDWDNDGDLDFVATGWTGSRQATAIFINTGGVFSEYANNATLPGVSESSVEVGDINNDSDLDIIITGFSGNDFDGPGTVGPYNRNVVLVINNPATTVNVRPNAPTGLTFSGNQASLTLSWTAATDATTPQAALSYNLFVTNITTGQVMYYPLADTTTGKLALQKMGNVQLNKSWILKGLPVGTYRWGVQAIDNSFMGSLFAKSGFIVNANGVVPIVLTEFTAVAEGKRAKLEWATSTELNNDRFEIERSVDGIHFAKIATVKSQTGSAIVKNYQVYDNAPLNGANFYRLVQFDVNGRSTTYGIKSVNFKLDPKAIVTTYPNPSVSGIGIRLSNYTGKAVSVMVTDVSGKMVHKETIAITSGQGYYKLNMAAAMPGQYIVKVMGESLDETIKAVVQ